MLTDAQHYFDESYRMAHCPDRIIAAPPDKLGVIVHELNNEFLETAGMLIKENIAIPMERFRLYSAFLEKALMDKAIKEKPFLSLQFALCTGSLAEGLLQLFLLAYKHDFIKAHWKQWNDTNVDHLYELSKEHLSNLVAEGMITGDQKKSLLGLLKVELRTRKNGKEIGTIMLDELIGLCRNQSVFTQIDHESTPQKELAGKEYSYMESIRDCRNNIHIFTNKPIPTFEIIIQNIRSYCLIVLALITRVNGLVEE